jgi:DNA-binding transcriptional MerR regulator
MAHEENGFMEYLELQCGTRLVTKSELLSQVRDAGFQLSNRQLTFYTSQELIPHSVRAGSRAGVYPEIVVELMIWLLYMRRGGVSIEALRELLPVWKFLIKARSSMSLDLTELEYIARQHVSSDDALSAVPIVVSTVLRGSICDCCRGEMTLIDRDGNKSLINESTTVGFMIASPTHTEDSDEPVDTWMARTRISLATLPRPQSGDPNTVRLGRKPNAALPPDEPVAAHDPHMDVPETGVIAT